jgi:hypothetical protein
LETNQAEIHAEIFKLGEGRWFLEAFYRFCKTSHNEVSVFKGKLFDEHIVRIRPSPPILEIEFSQAFLGTEIEQPSKASGVSEIGEGGEGLTWLIEHKRPTTVIKFSGTLVHHSHRTDIQSTTIMAFAQFVFRFVNKKVVFADLQGEL